MGEPSWDDAPDPRYGGVYQGEIVDNKDPLGIGRVRVCVPGLLPDDGGGWFLPMAGSGAGPQRGMWDIPDIGSEAYVQFLGGDPDKGRYLAGHWGKPEGVNEAPTNVVRAIEEDGTDAAVELKVWQSKTFSIVHDDRTGKERFFIRATDRGEDVTGGSALMIELDEASGVMAITAPAGIVIRSLGVVDIQGTSIFIGGRPVLQGLTKPI